MKTPSWAVKSEAGQVLWDYIVEKDILFHAGLVDPDREKIRRWNAEDPDPHLLHLLDEEEKPRRERYQKIVREVIEARIYPSPGKIAWYHQTRGLVSRGRRHGEPYRSDMWSKDLGGRQARWRSALLRELGWTKEEDAHIWTPPDGWHEDAGLLNMTDYQKWYDAQR